jgi:hypothetical protein
MPLTVRWIWQARNCMAVVAAARPVSGPEWTDSHVPADLGIGREGVVVRLPATATAPPAKSFAALCEALAGVGIDLRTWTAAQEALPEFFVLVCEDRLDLWWRCESQTDEIIHFETLIGLGDGSARVSSSYRVLAGKQVAVVGCGSAGSKIAASLARSGVGRFILVDDDVLLPENLVRNELDWRDVGSHKADALSARLKLVNPAVVIEERRVRLSAQEASGSAASVLGVIASCDLIVDATANPSVFNLLASVVAAVEHTCTSSVIPKGMRISLRPFSSARDAITRASTILANGTRIQVSCQRQVPPISLKCLSSSPIRGSEPASWFC